MSNLATLIAKARDYMNRKTWRYPVCLDDDIRTQLAQLRGAMNTAAQTAALVQSTAEKPGRRTIGDRASAVEQAMSEFESRAAELMAQAADSDALVVLVFGVPDAAKADEEGPAGWYRDLRRRAQSDAKLKPEGPTATELIMSRLAGACYLHAEAPDGTALDGMTWDDVRRGLLDDADAEQIEGGVLDLFRGGAAVPFDPANFGGPSPS